MLTVNLGFELSGNSRTWRPLGRAYSVIPSTEVTFWTPWGSCWASAAIADSAMAAERMANRRLRRIGKIFRGCRQIIAGRLVCAWKEKVKRGDAEMERENFH